MLRKGLPRSILLTLAALVDEADSYSYKNQMRRLYCHGWYKQSTVERSVRHLLTIGDIEKQIRNGQPVLRLTSQGDDRLQQSIPLLKLAKKKWDYWWRMVIFDIEEEKKKVRERLRYKLRSLGFGQWQRSVYISPHSVEDEINEYLDSQGLLPRGICLVTRKLGTSGDRGLAEMVWGLKDLARRYEKTLEKYEDFLEKQAGRLTGKQRQAFLARYENLLFRDPFLPKQLLPEDWPAEKLRRFFKKLSKSA